MSRPPRAQCADLAAEPYRELEEFLAVEAYHDLALGKGMFKEAVKKAMDKAAQKVHSMTSGTPKQMTATVSSIKHLCQDIEKSIQGDVNARHFEIVFAKKAALDKLFGELNGMVQTGVAQAYPIQAYLPRPPPLGQFAGASPRLTSRHLTRA